MTQMSDDNQTVNLSDTITLLREASELIQNNQYRDAILLLHALPPSQTSDDPADLMTGIALGHLTSYQLALRYLLKFVGTNSIPPDVAPLLATIIRQMNRKLLTTPLCELSTKNITPFFCDENKVTQSFGNTIYMMPRAYTNISGICCDNFGTIIQESTSGYAFWEVASIALSFAGREENATVINGPTAVCLFDCSDQSTTALNRLEDVIESNTFKEIKNIALSEKNRLFFKETFFRDKQIVTPCDPTGLSFSEGILIR
jgi:hypothetical protein